MFKDYKDHMSYIIIYYFDRFVQLNLCADLKQTYLENFKLHKNDNKKGMRNIR